MTTMTTTKRILRWRLDFVDTPQPVPFVDGARVVHVDIHAQAGYVQMWVEYPNADADPDFGDTREFQVVLTGQPVAAAATYIGTATVLGTAPVVHVYDVTGVQS